MSDTKREQVIALGRLGWSARRIQRETGVYRETASAYLKAAGIDVRPAGRWGHTPAKPAIEVSTDFGAPGTGLDVSAEPSTSKPAIEVSTDFGAPGTRLDVTAEPSTSKPAIEVSTDSRPPATGIGAIAEPSAAKPANEAFTDPGGLAVAKIRATLPQDARSEASPHPDTPSFPSGGDPETSPASSAQEVSTDSTPASLPPKPKRSPQASACELHRDFIELSLRRGRNAMAIFQDLVGDHDFLARYASVRRFVKKVRGAVAPQEGHPFIVTVAGEEAQVDYAGEGPMARHPETGKFRRTRLFILTLGYSRKCVRLLVWKSGTREWCELHEKAFRRLGGALRIIVLDNLREGVLKPDIYDPALNPLYKDVLKHYGAVALTCRVGDPDRKGKVESAVGHAQRTPLKGLRFESIEEAQAYLDRWEERWADTRIHGTTKRQVAAMFAEEKSSLLPLPLTPFRYYKFGKRTVQLNGCVEVDGAYYGPPPGRIGHELEVQWDGVHVRIIDPKTGTLLRELDTQRPGLARILDNDKPKRTPPTTEKLLNRAACAGRNIGIVCRRIHSLDGELGVKRILGVLRLAKTHGVQRAEQACTLALEVDVPTYRFVKRYIDKLPDAPLSLRQVDPLIRQLTLYRDLIDRKHPGEL